MIELVAKLFNVFVPGINTKSKPLLSLSPSLTELILVAPSTVHSN